MYLFFQIFFTPMTSPIRCLVFLFTLPRVIQTLHVLFYILLLGKSHIDFTDSLIESLVENGHTVDLIIARMNSHVKSNGTNMVTRKYTYGFQEESPWNKAPHLLNPFKGRERTWNEHTYYMDIVTDLCEIGLSDAGLHAFISSQKYDIGIATEYENCGVALMKYYKIPSIVSVSSLPILDRQSLAAGMPNSPAVTQAIFEAEDLTTYWGKFRNFLNWAHITLIINPYCEKHQSEVIKKHLGENFDTSNLIESLDLAFVNSNELIETPRVSSHKIKYIGGINLKKSKDRLDEEVEKVITQKPIGNGIVVFCFGTQVPSSLFPIEVRRAFAQAFRHFPDFTFVWKYEMQDGDEQIFANTTNLRLLKWLPQTDLLNDARTKAFISHVGLNSYLESSYAGVPILAVPLFADQPHNAFSGMSIGTTYMLDKTRLTTPNIVKGLEAVLYDSSYTLNAKRISKMLHERPNPPKKIFVEWIEFASRNPLLHRNLNLIGQNMSVFEYYCLDIISFCILLLSIVISVFYLGTGWVSRMGRRVFGILKKRKVE
ncbi:glucuronosyltransferase [Caenorhabditis elegans]|uniref:glucuronosyltransferase n=1 Tax=Caenorhabditis elegans TaxID=6239 RepID=O45109_CAEEL|nr:glucuronosyltransferase [Caenorhabditis elegans]CCD71943.1 glucuronosyltransferase [Caenorhabditis elegans]|eukprot:NP_499988.1 UDP-GlucuronosylTransferase [Caenorhabditis elegans]